MPFQNSFINIGSRFIPPVVLVTSGEDRIITCQEFITLEPLIVGDLTGHSVLWEQLSGVPVTWLTPQNQPIVQYQQTLNDDKQFRFWIDKGSAHQQFDDVWHFNTPIDDINVLSSNSLSASTPSGKWLISPNIHAEAIASDNSGTCHPTVAELEFLRPDDPELIERLGIEQFIIGVGWVEIDSIPKNEVILSNRFIYSPINFNESYRVVAYYNNSSSSHYIEAVKSQSTSPQIDGWVANSTFNAIGKIIPPTTISNYTTTLYTLKMCDDYEDECKGITNNPIESQITTYNVINRTLKTCPPLPIVDDFNSLNYNDIMSDIENYNVLDLTGGEIGG